MNRKVLLIAKQTLIDVFRHKVISLHLIFLLIASGLFNLFGHFATTPDLEYKMIQDVGISVINLFGLLMTLFIGATSIRDDLNRKTAYAVLTLPISRSEYYIGKFLGVTISTGVNILIMIAIFAGLLFIKFGTIWTPVAWILIFMCMEFSIVSALVLLFSLSDSMVLSFSFTFFLVVIGNLSEHIGHLVEELEIPMLSMLKKAVFLIVPNFELFNVKAKILKSLSISPTLLGWALAYTVLYISVTVFMATMIFERRDL
ncbi:MAG: ABC transporter permease subunit [Candidatus Riflebacteria bacterium]|nr:ABC transporter permease subunit [Candidatus Riflebacteria bacterium]